MDLIKSHHHLTLSVGGAQEDYDFHTQLLGLRSVKKTVLFDGTLPIYHLYYGNYTGDPGTLIACFAFRQTGIKGTRGTGQIKIVNLSVPVEDFGKDFQLPPWFEDRRQEIMETLVPIEY